MQPNAPTPDSHPVLIVSDGEEGNLVEKVIIEHNPSPTPAEQAAAETTDDAHWNSAQQVESDEKLAKVDKGGEKKGGFFKQLFDSDKADKNKKKQKKKE